MSLSSIFERQKAFFFSGKTSSYHFRKTALLKLYHMLGEYESRILSVMETEIGKPRMTAYLTEVAILRLEIKHALKNLKKWMAKKSMPTSFFLLPARSFIYPHPLGNILIIGTWNYPFYTILSPLIGAIAAGNCSIIKPSEMLPQCAQLLYDMLSASFESNYVCTILGDATISNELVSLPFNHIFFTGSKRVGKIILEKAAKNLTPVTLELGGKSPCIVDKNIAVDVTARRIVWGKFLNAGQTCVAPDYLFIHEEVMQPLIERMIHYVKTFYLKEAGNKNTMQRIVTSREFTRLEKLLENQKILYGGDKEEKSLWLSPTFIDNPDWDSPLMQEEIFGPLLPIIPYSDLNSVIEKIQSKDKPLALYLFTQDKAVEEKIMQHLSFGGGCINDIFFHGANLYLPFGGVGESGMGAYHGKYTFDLFSHYTPILKKPIFADLWLRYPPYSKHLKLFKRLF